jgi:transcriptional regulator with XRE-family HTH domain
MRVIMPAASPRVGDTSAASLAALGQRIRAHRKLLRVSATDAAEASGISRVTWHRVERGEPSVAMASYMSAIAALGLELDIVKARELRAGARDIAEVATLPTALRLADYPQLKRLAWQRDASATLSADEALALYERNWRHVDRGAMDARERALLERLARELGGGRLLVST